ncbi:MAG: DsrE family protein [Thiohalomonadaceae bacterium]
MNRPLNKITNNRRRVIKSMLAVAAALTLGAVQADDELRFPGDEPNHKIVYQFNSADPGYQDHVIFSVGAVLRKYGDDVKIVVVAIGEGIHLLGKKPGRPVKEELRQRASSLAQYGVEFHACGNTMKSLGWTKDDLLPFATEVEVGAADLMELQEQGYAYISW